MEDGRELGIQSAEVVLPCADLAATLAFFRERLGFRLESIRPADDPAVAVLSGHGLRLRLDRSARGAPGVLRLRCAAPAALGGARELRAPNGTLIELAAARPALVLHATPPTFVVSHARDAAWTVGRAGMLYRDLVPGRQGGRLIASHIRIPAGGPVPDSVHFHRVRFQMIYCLAGWVAVVYEDQGPPFELRAGDCVLQPPEIRHRVLACSPGLEVIEVTSPAEHETVLDHELELPTPSLRPEREFGGQRFVRHEAAKAQWGPWRHGPSAGFEARDLGIGRASGGIGGAHVVRAGTGVGEGSLDLMGVELLLLVVLSGALTLETERAERLGKGDACVLPAGIRHRLAEPSSDLELLAVSKPALDLPPRG